jgi:pimeloyl-ACP methyl ester carboxylesterase
MKFCVECGTKLAVLCLQCGAENQFAVTYSHLVEKLILVGTPLTRLGHPDHPGQVDPEWRQWRQELVAKILIEDYEQVRQIFIPRACSEPGSRNLIEGRLRAARETPREVTRNFFLPYRDDPGFDDPGSDLRPLLPALRVPTLVLHGEEDRINPVAGGRYLADHIPGAQFYVFKGRGHNPINTAITEFTQVVRNFIRTGRAV